MISLSDYLGTVLRQRFVYGELDCCTFMADWLIARGLSDPMADRRGGYADRRSYRAAIRSEGGLVASCRHRFAAVGLQESIATSPGDVALVMAPIGQRRSGAIVWAPTGAIVVSELLRAMVTPDAGLVISRPRILMQWGLRHA